MPDRAFVEGIHLTHAGAATFTHLFDDRVIELMTRSQSMAAFGSKTK